MVRARKLSESLAQAASAPIAPPMRNPQVATASVTPAASSIVGPQPLGPNPISSK